MDALIHLFTTAGSGKFPVCGQATAGKGEPVTQAFYRDLCKACIAYQQRKSLAMRQRLRAKRDL